MDEPRSTNDIDVAVRLPLRVHGSVPGRYRGLMSIDSVLREALTLPSRERSEVVAKLLASLDDEASHDDLDGVRAAWSEELEHRARLALSGEDPGEPWSVVRDRAQAKLAR